MGQTLETRVPPTHFDSPPRLTVAKDEDATVVPLFNEGRERHVGVSPRFGDSRSSRALGGWLVQSLLVEAIVREEAGQVTPAEDALERALELAARDRVLLPFLVDPVPELLQRHARRHTAHAELIYEIVELRAELEGTAARQDPESLADPLTESESRILRLLATELSQQEIAHELYVSLNTVKTHVKHLYAKLDVRTRHRAVERARSLGLLTYTSRKPMKLPVAHSA
jgi:LuxR family maltose regulon positive regulatory protein